MGAQTVVLQNLQTQANNIQSQIELIETLQDEQKQLKKLQLVTNQIEELKKQLSTECKKKLFKGKLCRLYQKQLLTLQTQKLATDNISRSGGRGGGSDSDGPNKIKNWTEALVGVLGLITGTMLVFKKDDI